ncbi:MAG TPA: segregation/condensation protein A [Dehalococcoidia bacterium]|jgi:segregation and condensation protein A|nr:segregation/condensation protein A [Dehalococcoidia bacterium]
MPEIRLPVFEGPLELLLSLIERNDLDITTVSLVAVTEQYLAVVKAAEGDHLPALADFVAIGARLIQLKSRALLPRQPSDDDDESDEEDDGEDLVEMLREYQRFRPATTDLADRQEAGFRTGPRPVSAPVPGTAGLGDVTLETLRRLMLEALKRKPASPEAAIPADPTIPLAERIRDLRSRLGSGKHLSFTRLVTECATRGDVIVTFLAVLELLKSGVCDAIQTGNWEDIEIVSLSPAPG